MNDRRLCARIHAPDLRARVRHGHRLRVIDVSPHGALVESASPLRPGSFVELQVEQHDRTGSFRAVVVRCDVSAISAHRGTTYRAGLAFRERCDWVCEAPTRCVSEVHSSYGESVTVAGHDVPAGHGIVEQCDLKGRK